MYIRSSQIFQKCRSPLKVLGSRKLAWTKFHTEGPRMLSAILQHLVPQNLWSPGYAEWRDIVFISNKRALFLRTCPAWRKWIRNATRNMSQNYGPGRCITTLLTRLVFWYACRLESRETCAEQGGKLYQFIQLRVKYQHLHSLLCLPVIPRTK
jgi:hypothetical protein